MHLTTGLITFILGILSFLVVGAGVVGLSFRVNRARANVDSYRDAADAWQKRSEAQAVELTDLQRQVAVLQTEVQAERDARHVLENVVTGKAALEALASEVARLAATSVTRDMFEAWQVEVRSLNHALRAELKGSAP